MSNTIIAPSYLFEVSWEVCNKIGGIHTVLATKANTIMEKMMDRYIVIGPDVYRDSGAHPEFVEDSGLYREWTQQAASEGLTVRIGRWKIEGEPVAFLVDFTTFFPRKDEIFKEFWELYHVDSISGQWDYTEPMMFGYATGKLIESFIRFYGLKKKRIVAHFHEWMTGAALLYLKESQPQVGTVFTTHATVIGRSMAGNNQPLYGSLESINVEEKARELDVVAKQSVEMITAQQADVYTTVSELTARECQYFHGRKVDLTTPNGFEDSMIPSTGEFGEIRSKAREKLLKVASLITGEQLPDDAMLIATSGRYEFRNKGIDLYIDALGRLNAVEQLKKPLIAYILIPANHFGPRKDLMEALQTEGKQVEGDANLTHYLHYADQDLILQRLQKNKLLNRREDQVKVVFVPSYLKGNDGIFNMDYYAALTGFDLTVFPSYYEPWGYTPMESLAFSIPTITTSLTGFGNWVLQKAAGAAMGITVISRDDQNDEGVVQAISEAVVVFQAMDQAAYEKARTEAFAISRTALWPNLITHYWKAYSLALESSVEAEEEYATRERVEQLPPTFRFLTDIEPVWRRLIVNQQIPQQLQFLEELARNIWWSWNREAVDLFRSVDPALFEEVEENPIVLLERMPYEKLKLLEKDDAFLEQLHRVKSVYEEYMHTPRREDAPSVAYFSMEYGLHNSLKIYSGGLGLLAGDYLKEASDYNYDMVGVGLLYRYGYFRQVITSGGVQVAHEDSQDFSRIPVVPVKDEAGNWKMVQMVLPGRTLKARIWKAQVGRVPLYLLDADLEENKPMDRVVTHRLYGGDHENRFKQELLLGIGGVRVLRELGIRTDLYHLNEGHAAFTGFERLREYIMEYKMTYPEAREVVRSTSLFTTHTPVPAGHDKFDENMMRTYLSHYPERLTISWNRMMNLGRENHNDTNELFSMSVLAVNLSQEVNGVSKLHGQVSREMFKVMWKGYMADELHIGHVTNGVHLSTWLSDSWRSLYLREFGHDFLERQEDRGLWEKIRHVKDEEIWKIRSAERKGLMEYIRKRLSDASASFLEDPRLTIEIADSLDENTLTIGFARRFATYKRAHLLFKDLDRLARIVNNPEQPIQFIFAGKAHPKDEPGQALIKRIVEISKMPAFIGKVIFLQNYNIQLAKRLLHGVDIWLNTPTRPLEASGTSGEKAVMNGGLHFSVLDGWWAEGYRENAGWALPVERTFENQEQQDELDAERIYSLFENEIAPKFYNRDKDGVPTEWVEVIKNSIAGVAPEFTMNRMLRDYIDRFYSKLYDRSRRLRQNDYRLIREISYFKKQIMDQWQEIKVLNVDLPAAGKDDLKVGESLPGSISLDLNGIAVEHIGVEMVIAEVTDSGAEKKVLKTVALECTSYKDAVAEYKVDAQPGSSGQYDIGFRIYPKMEELPHRMDLPLVKWI